MNIVIAGLGVIGGSFAMALTKAGYQNIFGIDTNEQTLKKAKEQGYIQDGDVNGGAFLKEADLTILCIYPHSVPAFLKAHAADFKPGSVITDVTGVKSELASQLNTLLPPLVDFVPGHPMAGREKMGFDFASDAVFKNANYLLTPLPANKEENLRMIETLALELGFKRVRRISPKTHDMLIAHTSQLPHALAVALINSDREGRETGQFIGDSYRDLTRIARINGALWSELFLSNKEHLLEAIGDFNEQLLLIEKALQNDDKDTLIRLFEKSTIRREKLDS